MTTSHAEAPSSVVSLPRGSGPWISSLTPNHGPAEGGNKAIINGQNLGGVIEVHWGKAKLTLADLTGIGYWQVGVKNVPAGTAGASVRVYVTARDPETGSLIESNTLWYQYDSDD